MIQIFDLSQSYANKGLQKFSPFFLSINPIKIISLIKSIYIIILCSFISLSAFAKNSKRKDISWRDNWKMEIKTGAVKMLTSIPDHYLFNTNNLNVPVGQPGPLGSFSLKKVATSHIEMGYQFDYLRLQGEAHNEDLLDHKVLTQIYSHTLQIQYNFKKNNTYMPPFNYFLYFKMGGAFMKNNLVDKANPDSIQKNIQKNAIPQALVLGLGAGINYQLTDNFSLTGTLDINNSTNGLDKNYMILNSTSHINYNMQLSFGLCWWFNLQLNNPRKNNPHIWFDNRRGF